MIAVSISLYSTRTQNTWRRDLALGTAPDARIFRWGYQHVGILEPTQTLASGVICVTPDANPRCQSVEYRWRWVPGVGSLRWACTFHIFCVDFICVGHPTQTRFSVEYGLYSFLLVWEKRQTLNKASIHAIVNYD